MPHRGWPRELRPCFVHCLLCSRTWPRQDRIEITSENMTSWLVDSPIVRGSRYDSGRVTSRLIQKLELQPGDIVWIGKQRDRPEVKGFLSFLDCWSYDHILGGINSTWSAETSFSSVGSVTWWVNNKLPRIFYELTSYTGTYSPTHTPHFHWITEFPLFTRADAEKDLFAKGRWSSTHHPFTAPVWQDVEALFDGRISEVGTCMRGRFLNC